MDTTSTPQTGKFGKIDDESNAMELLDKYGTSLFVDAIESSRLDRAFQKRSTARANADEAFWDSVRLILRKSDVNNVSAISPAR